MAIGLSDGAVQLWSPMEQRLLQELAAHGRPVQAIRWAADAPFFLTVCALEWEVKVWHLAAGQLPRLAHTVAPAGVVMDAAFHPAGGGSLISLLLQGAAPTLVHLPHPQRAGQPLPMTTVPLPVAAGRVPKALTDAVPGLFGKQASSRRAGATKGGDLAASAAAASEWSKGEGAALAPFAEQMAHIGALLRSTPSAASLRQGGAADSHIACCMTWGGAGPGGRAPLFVGTSSGYIHRVEVEPPSSGAAQVPGQLPHSAGGLGVRLAASTRMASKAAIFTLQACPQGKMLLAHSGEGSVDFLDAESLAYLGCLPALARNVTLKSFSLQPRPAGVQAHFEAGVVAVASGVGRQGHAFLIFDCSEVHLGTGAECPRSSMTHIPDGPGVSALAWHPIIPMLVTCGHDGSIALWAWGADADWLAFSPYFPELGLNVEYIEREEEFDALDEAGAALLAQGKPLPPAHPASAAAAASLVAQAGRVFDVAGSLSQRVQGGLLPAALQTPPPPSSLAPPLPVATQGSEQSRPTSGLEGGDEEGDIDVVGGLVPPCLPWAQQPALYGNPALPPRPLVAPAVRARAAAPEPATTSIETGGRACAGRGMSAAAILQACHGDPERVTRQWHKALIQEGLLQLNVVGRAPAGNASLYDASAGYFGNG